MQFHRLGILVEKSWPQEQMPSNVKDTPNNIYDHSQVVQDERRRRNKWDSLLSRPFQDGFAP